MLVMLTVANGQPGGFGETIGETLSAMTTKLRAEITSPAGRV